MALLTPPGSATGITQVCLESSGLLFQLDGVECEHERPGVAAEDTGERQTLARVLQLRQIQGTFYRNIVIID